MEINNQIYLFAAIISDILSCRLFLITTRLAYAVYLTQFPIFFYNVGRVKHSGYYNFITSTVSLTIQSHLTRVHNQYLFIHLQGNLYEIICILVISAILTLLFDMPFQNIKTVLLKRKTNSPANISHPSVSEQKLKLN